MIIALGFVIQSGCIGRDNDIEHTLSFWHAFEGEQCAVFEEMVEEYNATIGAERRVRVIPQYKTEEEIESFFSENIGSNKDFDIYPEIAILSGEVACVAHMHNMIVPAECYLTQEEMSHYFSGFLSEGRITGKAETYIFPLSKKVETTIINGTMWNVFSADQKISVDQWNTWDDICQMGEQYYDYSGGKAFIAFEDLKNFVLAYSAQKLPPIIQTGNNEIKININKETLRGIWDIYFGGVIRGYVYQTEDVLTALETGNIMAYIGELRERKYFPDFFINNNGVSESLSIMSGAYPVLNSSRNILPQIGDGASVFDHGEETNKESYVFLNWLCTNERIVEFSASQNEIASCESVYRAEATDEYFKQLATKDNTKTNMLTDSINQILDGATYGATEFVGYEDFCDELVKSLKVYARNGAQKVQHLMKVGRSFGNAVRITDNNETFEAWYTEILEILEKY